MVYIVCLLALIPDSYCHNCKKNQKMVKKMGLWKLPEILILHLKRFKYADLIHFSHCLRFSQFSRKKLNSVVDFPIELDVGNYLDSSKELAKGECTKYSLVAVSVSNPSSHRNSAKNHIGSLYGGHYIAHCLKTNDKNVPNWYIFDDQTVTEVKDKSVICKDAYLLFYQRN